MLQKLYVFMFAELVGKSDVHMNKFKYVLNEDG